MSLEKRLERLERALGGQEAEVIRILLIEYGSVGMHRIRGWRDHRGLDCLRRPGETDEALAERAEAEARVRAVPNESRVIVLYSYGESTQ